ncbi:MAG: CpsB/CapC family capsule biosynthesis tyrosine phosphatase [Actinomycetota bacterium]|nr:CpsB/CapC family capsule biosynthesis tyrosine phosphatase [Actinomycetota bacterium]
MPFTDIHSHILPGFDDGASSDEEFLEMARVAVRGGTSTMAATPHYDLENLSFGPGEIADAVEKYNRLLAEKGLALVLTPGVEIRINAGLFNLAKEGDAMGELRLGGKGRYVLLDLPLVDIPVATPDILFQVQLCGVGPILAHPERNRYLVEHPSVIRELVERGVELQVNSGSLEGIYGKSARRTARRLLKEGTARLMASDAHSPRNRNPDLLVAARSLRALLDDEAVRTILEDNPNRVLSGEDLLETTGAGSRKQGSRHGLLRRRTR